MSILAQLVIALAIFAAGGATGIKWQVGVVAARDLKAVQDGARVQLRRIDAVDVAATGHEQFKQRAAARETIIEKEVQRVTQSPVYSNVCLDVDGLRLIADDIAARAPAGQPAPAMPAPAAADPARWQSRAALDARDDPRLQPMR